MARRIVRHRTLDSRFRVGQWVRVDGDADGPYVGVVTQTHRHLVLGTPDLKLPGVTILVTQWEGVRYDGAPGTAMAPFSMYAHDRDCRRLS